MAQNRKPARRPQKPAAAAPQPAQAGRGSTVEDKATGEIIQHHGEMAMSASSAAARARLEAAVVLAMRNPRDEDEARTRILDRCADPVFAKEACYDLTKYDRGEGFTIRFAEEMLLSWKNVGIRRQLLYQDEKMRVVNVAGTDYEANITYDTDVTVHKTVERRSNKNRETLKRRINSQGQEVYIVRATEEETDTKEAALVSKAIRTQGLRLIPSHIKKEAWNACMATQKGTIRKDPKSAKQNMVLDFSTLGVTAKMIEDLIGHPASAATDDEMDDLLNIYNAIVDGATTWDEVVAHRNGTQPEEQQQGAPAGEQGNTIAEADYAALVRLCDKHKVTFDQLTVHLGQEYGVVSVMKLDRAVYDEVCAWVKRGGK